MDKKLWDRVMVPGEFDAEVHWEDCIRAVSKVDKDIVPPGSILGGYYEWVLDHEHLRVYGHGPYVPRRDKEDCRKACLNTTVRAPRGSILWEYLQIGAGH